MRNTTRWFLLSLLVWSLFRLLKHTLSSSASKTELILCMEATKLRPMQRVVDMVALVIVVAVDLIVVMVVSTGAMVPRERHHNLLDALKTDVSTRSVKFVRRKDTQPWIAGIVTTSYSSSSSKTAAAATQGYGVDTNWYTDTAATDHITSELDKLTVQNKYKGSDQIVTASGAGMDICNTGHAVIKTPIKFLHLKNILHVPTAQKNLVSVHHLTSDNHTSLEYFPHYFLVKDLKTRRVLLHGRCKDGLYPLPSSSHWQGALDAIKISPNRWHSRLGHPSPQIV
jgi:hypothetical protein